MFSYTSGIYKTFFKIEVHSNKKAFDVYFLSIEPVAALRVTNGSRYYFFLVSNFSLMRF